MGSHRVVLLEATFAGQEDVRDFLQAFKLYGVFYVFAPMSRSGNVRLCSAKPPPKYPFQVSSDNLGGIMGVFQFH